MNHLQGIVFLSLSNIIIEIISLKYLTKKKTKTPQNKTEYT